ncbi:MAG: EamA/RhaT family transporter [Betaproteobacteria bacterium]|nr:EamA/RhaT family transporter [Betaproteobacteria bacterium]MSQ89495.1 EamA/RhaT family transporter [Betaproteobacteria bacterium]
MEQNQQDQLPARLWWVLAGLTVVWGFNWTAMKVAIADIAPFTFRTLCLGLGSGVLFAFLRASGQSLAIPRDQWGRLALIAFFNITCWNVLVVYGLALLPSGRTAILAYTMPAWAIPLSILLLGERLSARKLLGLALGMGGMALLVWDEFNRIQGAPHGALMVLGAAFTWAIGTILQKKYPVRAPLAAFTGWLMLLGGVPIYIGALLFEDFSKLADVGLNSALGTAYNVLLAFAWAHWAWIKLASSVSVTVFSLSMLMIPVVGVFSGILFLGERPGWPEYTALALVLGSLASVIVPRTKAG